MKPNKAMRRVMTRVPKTQMIVDQVARINDISATCKTTWYGLLSYLAFVGVTWMGVEDVDFFLPGRDTELPLIGVSVPTLLFFAIGPTIGTLIYSYFHLQLLKLWEALAEADSRIDNKPLSDHIKPWLVCDLCLSYRTDGALRPRPLARSSHFINFLIAFWGTPIVLAAMWWASAPPHTDWLTLLACGLPLIVSLYIGLSSWVRMRGLVERPGDKNHDLSTRQIRQLGFIALLIFAVGWLRVEGTFRNYASALWTEDEITGSIVDWNILTFLRRANLAGVNFANTPAEWKNTATFRRKYRRTWCIEVGLPADVCGTAPSYRSWPHGKSLLGLNIARAKWCENLDIDQEKNEACASIFSEYENNFEISWLNQRRLDLEALPVFDLRRADLRRAILVNVRLQGANLSGAQLQGANLNFAQLEGANLQRAQMRGANFHQAQLQDASFLSAKMQRTDLTQTRMHRASLAAADLQDANLTDAVLPGANLEGANLQGAALHLAEMKGVRLVDVQFDAETYFNPDSLRGAAIRNVDLTNIQNNAKAFELLEGGYGDASVLLPDGMEHPNHWPQRRWDQAWFNFEWNNWQASLPPGWAATDW